MSRWISAVLGAALAIALVALAYLVVDGAHLRSDMGSTIRYQEAEIAALRDLALRLSAGEAAPAAVQAAGKEKAFAKDGWLVAGPLVAKFDGNRLKGICGSASTDERPCWENDQ